MPRVGWHDILIYYSTIVSFHQIRSRERAQKKPQYTVVSRFDRFTTERIRIKTFHWFSVVFTSFARASGTRYFLVDRKCRCILTLLLKEKKKPKIKKSFCNGIINLLIDGFAYNTHGRFAHCSHFSSPLRGSEKYYATRKISVRIICKTID